MVSHRHPCCVKVLWRAIGIQVEFMSREESLASELTKCKSHGGPCIGIQVEFMSREESLASELTECKSHREPSVFELSFSPMGSHRHPSCA